MVQILSKVRFFSPIVIFINWVNSSVLGAVLGVRGIVHAMLHLSKHSIRKWLYPINGIKHFKRHSNPHLIGIRSVECFGFSTEIASSNFKYAQDFEIEMVRINNMNFKNIFNQCFTNNKSIFDLIYGACKTFLCTKISISQFSVSALFRTLNNKAKINVV